jgi:hypothetical protein
MIIKIVSIRKRVKNHEIDHNRTYVEHIMDMYTYAYVFECISIDYTMICMIWT